MNLTKCFVAGLCISALTASAGFIKSNAFETADAGTDWTFDGIKGWDSEGIRVANDSTNNRASYSSAEIDRPYASAANTKVLALNTEGGVWTNTINQQFATTAIYVDMLVKFVPSEELPLKTTLSGKLAIAVMADVNGTNRLNIAWDNSGGFGDWLPITSKEVSTSSWHRITVKMYAVVNGEDYIPWVTVYLDRDQVLDQQINGLTLAAIGFSGTGFIDEVVVRDDDPFVTEIPLTLSFATGIDSVYVGVDSKTNGATVLSGDSLIITASKWYEIANVAGTDVTTNWVAGVIGDSAATVTVTAAAADKTVTITARTETSTDPQGGSTLFNGQQANKVAAWAIANGVTTLLDANYPQYLFNIATNATVPTLSIKSVAISNTTATVSVQAGTTDFSPSAINGALKIKGYPTLGGTPEVYGGFTGTTNAIFVQDIGTNKFIRAMVDGVPAPQ